MTAFIAFFSLLFLTQVSGNLVANVVPRDLMDDAQALLAQIKHDGQIALDQALTYLEEEGPGLLHNIANLAKDVGTKAIVQQSDILLNRLKDVKDAAAQQGLDISKCLGSESLLNEIGEIETQNIMDCIDGQEENTLYNFEAADREVQNTFRAITDTEKTLNSCERSDAACISNMYNFIQSQLKDVPDMITQERTMMGHTFEQASSLMGDCYTTFIYDIRDKGDAIFEQIQYCIDNL